MVRGNISPRFREKGKMEKETNQDNPCFALPSDDSLSRFWRVSYRADKRALPIADRHYNRQKVGSPQFVPPGRCIVLLTQNADALWVTSYPFAEYVKHQWAGAWVCSCFRNEGAILSSTLITEAVAITHAIYKTVPPLGMITFVNPAKVRRKRDFGRCYIKAGFERVGETKGGLIALQLKPERMPQPVQPFRLQPSLFRESD